MKLPLKVAPGASRDEIAGWLGDTLKVRVTAAPEKGRANAAVTALLAERLSLPKRSVRLVAGGGGTRKLVEIDGLDLAEVRRRLG